MNDWYHYDLETRRRLLAEAGFTRDRERVWSHADGRAVGESVIAALTDAAFARYAGLGLPPPEGVNDEAAAP
jgi:hypothetical protein